MFLRNVAMYVLSAEFVGDLKVFCGQLTNAWFPASFYVIAAIGVLGYGWYLDCSMRRQERRDREHV